MLASGTETVFTLGLGDQLVAISHECDYPPGALHEPRISRPVFEPGGEGSRSIDAAVREALPSRGAVYQLDEPLLHRLQPDLVITHPDCEVCAVPTTLAQRVVETFGNRPTVLSLDAHSTDDILQPIAQIGTAVGKVEGAMRCVESLRGRIGGVRRRVTGARVVEGVETLAALLHRGLFLDYDLSGRAAAWG